MSYPQPLQRQDVEFDVHSRALEDAASSFLSAAQTARTALRAGNDEIAAYHSLAGAVHCLCAAIRCAEAARVPRNDIRSALEEVRRIHAESPFISRLQSWPRGYPGDFETIEYLLHQEVRVPPRTVAYFLEHQALRSLAAQQHRNKVEWQAGAVRAALNRMAAPRVLSVACGSSPDLRRVLPELLAAPGASVVINDADADGLSFSSRALSQLGERLRVVAGDVFMAMRKLQRLEPFDVILAGGLFDYLSDKQIIWLLRRLSARLRPGGSLHFTNIAENNPDRVWIEHCGDWVLVERSEEQLRMLADSCGPGMVADLTRDPTGLACLVTINRQVL